MNIFATTFFLISSITFQVCTCGDLCKYFFFDRNFLILFIYLSYIYFNFFLTALTISRDKFWLYNNRSYDDVKLFHVESCQDKICTFSENNEPEILMHLVMRKLSKNYIIN